jgi:hypothetical protein
MDNKSLADIIENIPILKYKFLGSFPANFFPVPHNETFIIINTDNSDSEGSHWIMIANRKGKCTMETLWDKKQSIVDKLSINSAEFSKSETNCSITHSENAIMWVILYIFCMDCLQRFWIAT